MQQIKSFFLAPNPKQFFYLILAYSIFVLPISYFMLDHFLTIMPAVGLFALLIYVYQFQTQEKIQDQKIVYFMPSLLICGYLIFYGGILFRGDLIENRQHLQQVTGVIPAASKYVRGHGKGARSRDYLVIDGRHLHCAEDDMNSCEKMYQYQGKTATVYYQADSHVGGLAYEIIVDNQKIYDFEQQLQAFKQQRQNENKKVVWSILLFLLPSIYFYILSRGVLDYVHVMNEEEVKIFKEQQEQEAYSKNIGFIGWSSVIIGTILFITSISIFMLSKPSFITFCIGILSLGFALLLMLYIPNQIAKKKQAHAQTPPPLPSTPPPLPDTKSYVHLNEPVTDHNANPIHSVAMTQTIQSDHHQATPTQTISTTQRKFRQRPKELETWQKVLRIVLLIIFIPISLFMIALSLFAIFTGERTLSNIIATAIIICVCISCIWIVKKTWSWKHRMPKSKRQRRY